ncbi:MAG: glucose-6-phosphate dehydrogenase [Candidatus Levybacteria bacterium]|nr:glucose-6-phosphate dehydrogenase [Candidatus Levybacteria bacterium]
MSRPFIMVVFGGTGDLARNKLFPALFSLYKQKKLPEQFFIVGFARRDLNDEKFREVTQKALDRGSTPRGVEPLMRLFLEHVSYQQGFFDNRVAYEQLIERLNTFDKKLGACITRFFYLATPPDHYEVILDHLSQTKLSEGCGHPSTGTSAMSSVPNGSGQHKWTRLIIEKPFGKDLNTARMLDKKIAQIFEEKQIFRVDHYLGKETVQNILTFRFANGIFEPVWNKNYIDHVQITWAEKKGIEGRGAFFDGVGILRDVAQNHLMQLIASVAMEQPKSFSKEAVRDVRADAIRAIRCIDPEDVAKLVVRGQYNGYQAEKNVTKNSNTETFTAMKLFIDTPRFENVPFYVRAGKKMPKDEVLISIVFIQTCHILFKEYGCPEEGNVLTIRIQPDEGIGVRFIAKKPGAKLSLGTVDMKFSYQDEFDGKGADAYEKVLLDIFAGDQMLFNRSDELESSWEFITKILEGWKSQKLEVRSYEPGTWGPKDAEELIKKDGRKWL